jgi:hypothetical protein
MCRVIMAKNITSFFLKNDLLVNRIICRYSNYGKKKLMQMIIEFC